MGSCCRKAQRDRDRERQQKDELDYAKGTIREFCESTAAISDKYKLAQDGEPRKIGGRLGKYWFLLREINPKRVGITMSNSTPEPAAITIPDAKALLTLSPLSLKSRADILGSTKSMQDMNSILRKVSKHPHVHPIDGIWYIDEERQIVTLQKFMERSLRDYLCLDYAYNRKRKKRESFLVSWSKKYRETQALEYNEVACIGRQILEAMRFLYRTGFTTLGHIHSGNIFVQESPNGRMTCQLAGYDMLLLGYRTRLYYKIRESGNLHRIDMIMFGHVIFEMAAGSSLSEAVPSEFDYDQIDDEELKRILKFIFDDSSSVKKLLQDHFFNRVQLEQTNLRDIKVALSADEKELLQKVTEPYSDQAGKNDGFSERWRDFKKTFSQRRQHRKRRQRTASDRQNLLQECT